MSGKTYAKSKEIRKAVEENPVLLPIVKELNRTGNVSKAAREVKAYQEAVKDYTPPSPRKTYPHSDLIKRWMEFAGGQMCVINNEQGGIEALLAEPSKWDWPETKTFILSQLRALIENALKYEKAIKDHASKN